MNIQIPPPSLVLAYESTIFVVSDSPEVALHIGDGASTHSEWLNRHKAKTATIITAFNPFSAALSEEANEVRQKTLKSQVRAAGLSYLEAAGHDPSGKWPPEASICVWDAPENLLDDWLIEFGQYAVVQVSLAENCGLLWHPDIRVEMKQ